ncbi:MAG TPA: GNAT family N-acetyltransferase [Patescibacteria group bacterium]|nr:GNAT family N-acetyltransferase [Patescibacteria group bacterium]
MAVLFEDRDMTAAEFAREQKAFDEHGLEFGNPKEEQERFGFVATDSGKFIGAVSGLAQKNGDAYGKYFYLSDLLVEKEYRKRGYGKKLLELLEDKMKSIGITQIWTWTAEFEAETFYKKLGYKTFTKFEGFYPSGHSRVGMIKKL